MGKVYEDLYYMTKDSFIQNKGNNMTAQCNSHNKHLAMLWHARLGHISNKRLKHVNDVHDCDFVDMACPVCPMLNKPDYLFSLVKFLP